MSDTYLPGFSAQTPSALYPTAGLCIPTVFLQTAAFMTINVVNVSADVCVLLPLWASVYSAIYYARMSPKVSRTSLVSRSVDDICMQLCTGDEQRTAITI